YSVGAAAFLARLSHDLQARSYRPFTRQLSTATDDDLQRTNQLRDRIVQSAATILLNRAFWLTAAGANSLEESVQWVARVIHRGLTRIYTESVRFCPKNL